MRRSGLISVCLIAFVLSTTHTASAGLVGVFQGKIVKSSVNRSAPGSKVKTPERWLYVQSRNGAVRRVNVAKALVEYDEDVPAKQRRKNPAESLRLATEVRITAEQDHTEDGSGDWQAQHVLILAPATPALSKPAPGKTRTSATPGLLTTL